MLANRVAGAGFRTTQPRYRRVHAFARGRNASEGLSARVDCTWLRDVLHYGYGVWHAIQGPWLLGAVPRQQLYNSMTGALFGLDLAAILFRGGYDLRAVVVHVVVTFMYVVAPVAVRALRLRLAEG